MSQGHEDDLDRGPAPTAAGKGTSGRDSGEALWKVKTNPTQSPTAARLWADLLIVIHQIPVPQIRQSREGSCGRWCHCLQISVRGNSRRNSKGLAAHWFQPFPRAGSPGPRSRTPPRASVLQLLLGETHTGRDTAEGGTEAPAFCVRPDVRLWGKSPPLCRFLPSAIPWARWTESHACRREGLPTLRRAH